MHFTQWITILWCEYEETRNPRQNVKKNFSNNYVPDGHYCKVDQSIKCNNVNHAGGFDLKSLKRTK